MSADVSRGWNDLIFIYYIVEFVKQIKNKSLSVCNIQDHDCVA